MKSLEAGSDAQRVERAPKCPRVKRCRSCGETLPVDAFARKAHAPDGRSYSCKPCRRARDTTRRARERARRAEVVAGRRAPQSEPSPPQRCADCRWRSGSDCTVREAPTPARYRTALDCPLWSPLEEPPLRAVDCLRYRSPMADLQLEESVECVQGRKGHNNRRENKRLTRRMEVLDVGAAWNMRERRDDDDRDGMG